MTTLGVRFLVAALVISHVAPSHAQSTVFVGRPSVKVSEGGIERLPERLPTNQSVNLECVISEINGEFFWASRRNVPLVRVRSDGFDTYVAANGAGYIKIIRPESKNTAALMSGTEKQFDYVEHVSIGLRTVTYFGSTR